MKANLYEPSRFQGNYMYRETAPYLSYLEQPGHFFALTKNNTSSTRNLFPLLGESTDEKKVLLFFTGLDCVFSLKIRLLLS